MVFKRLQNIEELLSRTDARHKQKERRGNSCWECCKILVRKGEGQEHISTTKKCSWKDILTPCLCCYVDSCPLRAFLLIIAGIRIAQHLSIYIWHTFRLKSILVEIYVTETLESGKPSTTANFELWWHFVTMSICILEICLYTRLFCGALVIFPQMGWRWFYLCWVLTLVGITLSILVLVYFKEVHFNESLWTIISRSLVLYEMCLWSFHAKQIEMHGNTYGGKRSILPGRRTSVNPRIFDDEHKLPFEPYHVWDDNSYSLAEEYLLANNKFSSPRRPRRIYTKSELKKRLTGLTNDELETAIDNYTPNNKMSGAYKNYTYNRFFSTFILFI